MGAKIVAKRVGSCERLEDRTSRRLAGQLAQKFPLVHAVLEGFAAVDEHDRDFVSELAAQLFVTINVDFLPAEKATALQLDQAFLDDLAKMTTLSGVDQHLAGVGHERECSSFNAFFNWEDCKES